jgi:hypothetical protein
MGISTLAPIRAFADFWSLLIYSQGRKKKEEKGALWHQLLGEREREPSY